MPIIYDPMPTFPKTPSYGFVATPTYRVGFVEREGGFEKVNRIWDRPLLAVNAAPFENTTVEDMETILNFYHAMGGMSTYFRFKDESDYQSVGIESATSEIDQPLVAITGSPTLYQLVKYYTVTVSDTSPITTVTQVREIYKPRPSTIEVANEVGTLQATTAYTLDAINGTVQPNGTFSGTPTFWGGQFDVEVRFNSELSLEISSYGTRATSFQMREKRRPATTT